jgi:hypothetical protein
MNHKGEVPGEDISRCSNGLLLDAEDLRLLASPRDLDDDSVTLLEGADGYGANAWRDAGRDTILSRRQRKKRDPGQGQTEETFEGPPRAHRPETFSV